MMQPSPLNQLIVGIKGAGEQASAAAHRLFNAHIRNLFMLETPDPAAVRRSVSFCAALRNGQATVEDVRAVRARDAADIHRAWAQGAIAVLVDPHWQMLEAMKPDIVIDAILAKRNLGTCMDEAPLVIALGPGFTAGIDAHTVIETRRGHHLGRVITSGVAAPNTGKPGNIGGYTVERVLRAPCKGIFTTSRELGDWVKTGDGIATVDGQPVRAAIDGMIRGLLRSGRPVHQGMKLGDIDPRGDLSHLNTISDKGRAIAGAVLEAILRRYNTSI